MSIAEFLWSTIYFILGIVRVPCDGFNYPFIGCFMAVSHSRELFARMFARIIRTNNSREIIFTLTRIN